MPAGQIVLVKARLASCVILSKTFNSLYYSLFKSKVGIIMETLSKCCCEIKKKSTWNRALHFSNKYICVYIYIHIYRLFLFISENKVNSTRNELLFILPPLSKINVKIVLESQFYPIGLCFPLCQ